MLYDYQYDVAGMAATGFLLIVYLLRRNYRTKSNIILLLLMLCNILACVGDIWSCFTISYPDRFPMWMNYASNMMYLFFYNMLAVLFYLFVDSKAKIEFMWKKSMVIAVVTVIYLFSIIVSNYWTDLVFGFDENKIYYRGPMMYSLYVIASALLIAGILLFYLGRKRFNRYQIVAIASFVFVIIFCVAFQFVFSRYLIGQFGCALVLFFLYTAFENPVYYTYKDTRCFNRTTFLQTLKVSLRNQKHFSLVAFSIHDYLYLKRGMSLKDVDRLSSRLAEFLYLSYKDESFCIDDDKFIVLLEGDDANDITKRDEIFHKMEVFTKEPIMLIDDEKKISMNKWYLTGLDSSLSVDDIIDSLDNLMVKESDAIEDVYNIKDLIAQYNRRQQIVHILNQAVEDEAFEVYYQPIRNVETNEFTSVEALVRLQKTELGFISPEEFIPIAEESGTIYEIGAIVFKKVCQFMKEKQTFYHGLHYVEINLSPLQCFQEDLVFMLEDLMEEYQIDPAWINLEITETANFSESNTMSRNIQQLHAKGMTFSLDDYGSGFASIDYLFKLPVDIVKIDKGILWQAVKDDNAMIALKSTMKMLKDLGKHIVVEGVETKEMVDILETIGCDYMQGYYYSKPLPEDEYFAFLKSH